ncbi:gfo/Idh/MocA family oxidoreductase [Xylanibacillus composti]|uniref:Oxidoreductase n=1 Tax=Xylanibacillus composti TaxID=1572762 RepID=A0A8J4H9P8_9BACL|nr:Gfo/Idh/MocA family oxidoreductase [Xylanibacillus composti]MDT9727233.1 gfo/Idh/MocA family oxidoreductase [Xylanibacillus composti]GIQ71553.1 oxidoreductase [Xylanibacillus composti]
MNERQEGMNYAPKGKPNPVVKPNEFVFAAIGLDHGHIGGQCNGLIEAGATLKYIYDTDKEKLDHYLKMFPQAKAANSEEEILADKEVKLVTSANIACERQPLGVRVLAAGKDYFTDKAPMTTLKQLEEAKEMVQKTGLKYAVYYSERLHVESAVFAGELIAQGAIGKVVQTIGLGPHRLSADRRPPWFFEREQYGGILCDIGSHQIEQFLYFTGAKDAEILSANIENYNNPKYPGLDDFGDATLRGDNGTMGYFRVDWFTPDGLSTWGDGRTMILGTDGYIELRKYVDIARHKGGSHVYLVNKEGEKHFNVEGQVGYPFFGQLILDCINRTEHAMTQTHAFKAAELCIKAQMIAEKAKNIVRKY